MLKIRRSVSTVSPSEFLPFYKWNLLRIHPQNGFPMYKPASEPTFVDSTKPPVWEPKKVILKPQFSPKTAPKQLENNEKRLKKSFRIAASPLRFIGMARPLLILDFPKLPRIKAKLESIVRQASHGQNL